MRVKPYPQYKPSGIEWLGDVPVQWHVDRLKWSTLGAINGIWGEEPNEIDDTICVRVADFDRERLLVSSDPPTMRAVDSGQKKNRLLKKGDLLIEKSGGGDKQLVGCVVFFDHSYPAVCSNFVARLPIAPRQDSRFWSYVYAALYAGRLNYPAIKQTTGIQNLDSDAYLDNKVSYPPFDEQCSIANYLDCETAKIDLLVAKKRELIERLKEKRTALISRTVTRGLPPDAARAAGLNRDPKLKVSGIDWLSDVPTHWEVVPLGYLVRLRGGTTPDKGNAEYWDGEIPWVSPKDMKGACIADSEDHITEEALRSYPVSMIPRDAVLIVVRGMILAHSFPVAITQTEVTINQDMKALLCGPRLLPRFLFWSLSGFAQVFVSFTDESAHGTKKIETPTVTRFPFAVPPRNEQHAIDYYLDRETTKLDRLLEKVKAAMECLQEYRTALITAAVTGKIDVRDPG